jgi:hypothetical protein
MEIMQSKATSSKYYVIWGRAACALVSEETMTAPANYTNKGSRVLTVLRVRSSQFPIRTHSLMWCTQNKCAAKREVCFVCRTHTQHACTVSKAGPRDSSLTHRAACRFVVVSHTYRQFPYAACTENHWTAQQGIGTRKNCMDATMNSRFQNKPDWDNGFSLVGNIFRTQRQSELCWDRVFKWRWDDLSKKYQRSDFAHKSCLTFLAKRDQKFKPRWTYSCRIQSCLNPRLKQWVRTCVGV